MPSWGSGKDTLYGGLGVTQPRNSYGQFGGGSGVEWAGFEEMSANIEAWGGARIETIRANSEVLAADIEDYMKANAPWEDRTGDARESLQAQVVHDQRTVKIYLGYGSEIFYGYFLEHYTYNGISYAIIGPTIQEYSSHALSEVVR